VTVPWEMEVRLDTSLYCSSSDLYSAVWFRPDQDESAERIYEITNTFPVDEDVGVGGCLIPSYGYGRGAGHTELKPSLIGTETAVDACRISYRIVPYLARTSCTPGLIEVW
jgi:hypothetical protein